MAMISMPPSASASGRPLLTVENSRYVMKGIRGGGGGGKRRGGGGKKKKKGSLITILSADVIFPILFILHEIEYRDKLDSMDAREAEWEEDEIQILLQLDHGAAVVGVDGDVCSNIIVQFRGLSLGGDCDGR